MNEKETYKKLLKEALENPKALLRIINQIEKQKTHLGYKIQIFGVSPGQTRTEETATIITTGKTIGQVKQLLQKYQLYEGNELDDDSPEGEIDEINKEPNTVAKRNTKGAKIITRIKINVSYSRG